MMRALVVARWEFMSAVCTASFVGLAVGLPLVHIAIAALMGLSVRAAQRGEDVQRPISVVDRAGVLPEGTYGNDSVVRDEIEAFRALRERRIDAAVVLDESYLVTGRVRIYAHRTGGLLALGGGMRQRQQAESIIRRAALATLPSPLDRERERVLTPVAEVQRFQLDSDGRAVPDSGSALALLGGTFGLSFLLGLSIFLSSGLLQNGMAAERENRMLEVLLISVPPLELLTGKVIGLGLAGLLQIAVYLVLALGAVPALLGVYDIPLSVILWSVACFASGYVLFACLTAATAAGTRDVRGSANLATFWMLAGASPMFFITFISADPHSTLTRVLSWLPLTAPVTLLLRIGNGNAAFGEFAVSLILTLLTAALVLRAAARLMQRVAAGVDLRLPRMLK